MPKFSGMHDGSSNSKGDSAGWRLPQLQLEMKRRYVSMQIRKSHRILAAVLTLVRLGLACCQPLLLPNPLETTGLLR